MGIEKWKVQNAEDPKGTQPFCVRRDTGGRNVCGGISDRKQAVRCGGNVCFALAACVFFFVGCDVARGRRRGTVHSVVRKPNHTLNAGRVYLAQGGERQDSAITNDGCY
jgi:hypothetical protein